MVSGTPTWSTDLASGGAGGLWATSSNDLVVYPVGSRAAVVGNTATTTDGYIFEVVGNALFDDIDAENYQAVHITDKKDIWPSFKSLLAKEVNE